MKIKFTFKLFLMLLGYLGFSQGMRQPKGTTTVTFPNGDESIVITTGKQANLLRLTTNNQAARFEGLELSNHEVVHQRELPGQAPGLDSPEQDKMQYSVKRDEEEMGTDPLDSGSEAG